jgi:hypothetical protein
VAVQLHKLGFNFHSCRGQFLGLFDFGFVALLVVPKVGFDRRDTLLVLTHLQLANCFVVKQSPVPAHELLIARDQVREHHFGLRKETLLEQRSSLVEFCLVVQVRLLRGDLAEELRCLLELGFVVQSDSRCENVIVSSGLASD